MRLLALLLLIGAGLAGAAADAPPAPATAAGNASATDTAPAAPTAAVTAPGSEAPTLPPEAAWAPQLRRDAQAVLAGKDFKGEETSSEVVRREWLRQLLEPRDQAPDRAPDLRWVPAVAVIAKWLLVAVLVVALAWLLWRGWQWLAPQLGAPRKRPLPAPLREARSLALADTPLPADVSRAARDAWQAGEPDLALSLLYRGALRALERHYQIVLPASATEGECLRRARASGKAVVGSGFAPVVQAWMALAYARRQPEDFEQLLALYARHFELRTREEGAA